MHVHVPRPDPAPRAAPLVGELLPALPSPGGYLRLRRIAALLTVEDVAAQLACEPHLAEHDRAHWLRMIEAGVQPATITTLVALRERFRFSLDVLAAIAARALGRDVDLPDMCLHCGCSEHDPCVSSFPTFAGVRHVACAWADDARTLCTDCAATLRTGRPTPYRRAAA